MDPIKMKAVILALPKCEYCNNYATHDCGVYDCEEYKFCDFHFKEWENKCTKKTGFYENGQWTYEYTYATALRQLFVEVESTVIHNDVPII
jgi:hypothetical protein